MKKHIGVALGLCLSLTLVSVSSVSSAAPQIVGTKCVKAGMFRTAKSVKYQCKKSAQGLRWVINSPKNTPTIATATTTTTTSTTTTTIPLTCAMGGACVVGDKGPGGGIVFYVDSKDRYPSWQYLELAPTYAAVYENNWPYEGGVQWSQASSVATSYKTDSADDWFLPDYFQLATAVRDLYYIPSNPMAWAECATYPREISKCAVMWTSDVRGVTKDGFFKGDYAYQVYPEMVQIYEGPSFWSNGVLYPGTPTGIWKKKFSGTPEVPFRFGALSNPLGVRAVRGFNSNMALTTEPVETVLPIATSTTTTNTTTTTTIVVPLDSVSGITSVNNLLNVQECRIRDATFTKWSDVSSGFPRPDFLRGGFGQLEVLVIPVSFTDLQFSTTDAKAMETTYEKVHSFYSAMSYGQAAVKMTLAPSASWVEVGGTVEQNGLINTPPQWDGSNFYRKVIEIYLRNNTISGYDVVDVVSANTSRRMFGGQAMPSGSNSIYGTRKSFAGTQLFGSNAQNWGIVAHELGHAWLGFEDLYLFEGGSPLGNWDMMSNMSTEFGGWSRFLAGWIDSNWVRCASPRSPSQHYLSSLNADKTDQKPRMLVLPLNSQSAVIAELRVSNTWQTDIKNPTLVVYRVDTSIDHGKGPIVLVGTANQIGGTISTDGIKITVKGLNSSGVIIDVGN